MLTMQSRRFFDELLDRLRRFAASARFEFALANVLVHLFFLLGIRNCDRLFVFIFCPRTCKLAICLVSRLYSSKNLACIIVDVGRIVVCNALSLFAASFLRLEQAYALFRLGRFRIADKIAAIMRRRILRVTKRVVGAHRAIKVKIVEARVFNEAR